MPPSPHPSEPEPDLQAPAARGSQPGGGAGVERARAARRGVLLPPAPRADPVRLAEDPRFPGGRIPLRSRSPLGPHGLRAEAPRRPSDLRLYGRLLHRLQPVSGIPAPATDPTPPRRPLDRGE